MQVYSSLSGIPFYAPSAGYAPTNSGDVSAIASAYQVVSSTATQLYAGTAYVTSVNEAPISAARAGNAANASLANSAYYDGTGRLISALPDSAAVSAIASSYVESGVSSKQDTLSFAYNTADQISSINGSALGGMDEAAVSGIASAYAESAASSKQDTLTFGYNTADQISSIDGSSLAGGNSTTYGYDSADAISSIDGSAISDSRQGVDLFVRYPLFTGTSGTSAYIGYNGYNESTALLWSGAAVYTSTVTLHDYWTAYERLRLYGSGTKTNVHQAAFNEIPVPSGITKLNVSVNSVGPWYDGGTFTLCNGQNLSFLNGNKMSAGSAFYFGMQADQAYINCTYRVNGQDVHLYKVVGVNRTAGE